MLVNPNFFNCKSKDYYRLSGTTNAEFVNGKIDYTGYRDTAYFALNFPNLQDGKTYTLSLDFQTTASGAMLRLFDRTNGEKLIREQAFDIRKKGKIEWTFLYKSNYQIYIYGDKDYKTNGATTTFKNVKIEEGDKATPYIPNAKDLDISKQQLLTGGGYLQRGIPNLLLKRVVGYAS